MRAAAHFNADTGLAASLTFIKFNFRLLVETRTTLVAVVEPIFGGAFKIDLGLVVAGGFFSTEPINAINGATAAATDDDIIAWISALDGPSTWAVAATDAVADGGFP